MKHGENQEIEPGDSNTLRADQKKEKLCNIMRIFSVMAVIITVGSGTKVIPI